MYRALFFKCLCLFCILQVRGGMSTLEPGLDEDDVKKVKEILYNVKTDYEVVVPFLADNNGDFLDYKISITPQILRRYRRSSYTTYFADVNVMIPSKNGLIHLVLQPTSSLVSPGATVELERNNITERKIIQQDCFFQGGLSNSSQSFAAMSACDGLLGVLKTNVSGEEFFIEPMGLDPKTGGITHALYKKPILKYLKEQGITKDLLMYTDIDLSSILLPDITEETAEKRRRRRDVKREYFLEVLVAVGPSVVEFHGKDLIETYVLTIMNIVNSVYHHYTLGVVLNVVVVKIHLLDKKTHGNMLTPGSPAKTLDKFCAWAHSVNPEGDDHPDHHDHAIYLTRDDFGPAGYAPITGMCRPKRSCAVIKDDGLSSAFVVAHETGHVLGMEHDGTRNSCIRKVNEGNIMAALVQSNYDGFYWTECSKKILTHYIDSYKCLRDNPHEKSFTEILEPYGVTWSLSEQCRQEFGEGYELCWVYRRQNPCKQLWCGNIRNPSLCKTKKGPPLPGTACARNRWCTEGKCVPKDSSKIMSSTKKHLPAVNGAWSRWTEWGDCSRSCDAGVKYRTRRCNNPAPANYGKECDGKEWQHSTCNLQACPEGEADFREEQCRSYNLGKQSWRPAPHKRPDDMCKLTCVEENSGDMFVSEDYVIDGTPCSYDDRYSICVKGKCQKYGCDRRLNSTKQVDMCGECEGRNNKCKKVDGVYNRKLKYGYHKVLKLAKGTRHINIKKPYSPFYLSVKDNEVDKYYVDPVKHHAPEIEFIARGSKFKYIYNGDERLTTEGPLMGDIDIEAYSLYNDVAFSMRYEYVVPVDEELLTLDPKKRYKWEFSRWSECSKTCGTGEQTMEFVCRDKLTEDVVEGNMCKDSKSPRSETRRCSTIACPYYRWLTGIFGRCSKKCGSRGIQARTVVCVRVEPNKIQTQVYDKFCDDKIRPSTLRDCNRIPCRAKWLIGQWSSCSVTCGHGVQVRRLVCDIPPDGNNYECSGDKPSDSKVCDLLPCQETTSATTTTTTSATTTTTSATTTTTTATTTIATTITPIPSTTTVVTSTIPPPTTTTTTTAAAATTATTTSAIATSTTTPPTVTTATPTSATTNPQKEAVPLTPIPPPLTTTEAMESYSSTSTPARAPSPIRTYFRRRCLGDRSFFCKAGASARNCKVNLFKLMCCKSCQKYL